MGDNEIVKALGYFSDGVCGKCGCVDEELIKIIFDALDLINRQKAEIEMDDVEIKELRIALQGYLDDLTKERNLYKKSIEELNQAKAEIERLKRKLVAYEPSVDSGLFSQMLLEQKEKAEAFEKKWKAEIKAEAYREFAERLKEMASRGFWETDDYVGTEQIDNLLKELVGEDDG